MAVQQSSDYGGTRSPRYKPPSWSVRSGPSKASQRTATQDVSRQKPTGTTWYMPVAGMKQAPGDFASGKGNWSRGSFGYQKPASKGGHVHAGTDIYAEAGSAIVSPVAGTVISVGNGSKGGNFIKIRGTDGIEYYFAHMQEASPWKQGTKVQAGIFVGAVGNSGNASGTTPHLHFSMKKNGKSISPNAFLETGRQQKHTPLSAIPGLNTPEEVANWAVEESRRQAAGHGAMQGFDAQGIAGQIQEGQADVTQEGFGQQFLSATLNAQSRRIAGGERIPVPSVGGGPGMSTALGDSVSGGAAAPVPEAQAVDPVSGRQDRLETDDGTG